jgi:predicted hydrocarbon binding protein
MSELERKELLDILIQKYIDEKNYNKVWQREESTGLTLALGKLLGACMAFKYDFEETENFLTIFTRNKRKIILKIKKE